MTSHTVKKSAAPAIIATVLVVFSIAGAARAEETAPAPVTEEVQKALPPSDEQAAEPQVKQQEAAVPYSDADFNHSFGASIGLGSVYGEIEDPYRDDQTTPSSFNIGFLYRYALLPYVSLAGDIQFILASAEFNHNGVEPTGVIVNENGSMDISLLPFSAGVVISPGFFSVNPYLSAGGAFAFWDARQDTIVTQDGTDRFGIYERDSGQTYGYYLGAGLRLKPRKYYSYFIEFRYYGMQERDVLEYEDFDLRTFAVNLGFQFDYMEKTQPKY